MNARNGIAIAAAALTVAFGVPACSTTVEGYAVAAPTTPETTLSHDNTGSGRGITETPPKYRELAREIADATRSVAAFWKRQGINLDSVDMVMVSDETRAPCTEPNGVGAAEATAWTCTAVNAVTIYLPSEQADYERAGSGVPRFTVGHELGHMASYQRGITAGETNNEALADCLSGAAAAGTGTADQVTAAVATLFGRNSERHQVVQHGVDVGVNACFAGAR